MESTGGAERLVVDAAIGLQKLGHSVDIYTSHHDPTHCFDETRDGTLHSLCHSPPLPYPPPVYAGTLNVRAIHPPIPRAFKGKFHILLSHARQLHLTTHLLRPSAPRYDVYFVDQLSTCIPFLRAFGRTRVVFYCHFPDKLLADGAYVQGEGIHRKGGLLKRLYRLPMDWLEEITTREFFSSKIHSFALLSRMLRNASFLHQFWRCFVIRAYSGGCSISTPTFVPTML